MASVVEEQPVGSQTALEQLTQLSLSFYHLKSQNVAKHVAKYAKNVAFFQVCVASRRFPTRANVAPLAFLSALVVNVNKVVIKLQPMQKCLCVFFVEDQNLSWEKNAPTGTIRCHHTTSIATLPGWFICNLLVNV